jgi:hypothetical protein
MSRRILVQVEQALGPGVDFDRGPHGQLVGRRPRSAGPWLGYDRAVLVDSDDGNGRGVAALVAVPASTFASCRLEAELTGAMEINGQTVLIATLPGWMPPMRLAPAASGLRAEPRWLDLNAAKHVVVEAHQRYHQRRSRARILGGRAWRAAGPLPVELARHATPHSAAEYSLEKLPDRFVRGLEGLLDVDERILYWVERPMLRDVSVTERLRRVDRRAALLALTDRQLLWVVDHARPDAFLSDWGVDVELIPVERLIDVDCRQADGRVELVARTAAGERGFGLPEELLDEVAVMRLLASRFTPGAAHNLPRRTYPVDILPYDDEAPARFGQAAEAEVLHKIARRDGAVLGFLFSPRRPGQKRPAALVLRPSRFSVLGPHPSEDLDLDRVVSLSATLSPLVGRVGAPPGLEITVPAPLMERGAELLRLARRVLAGR